MDGLILELDNELDIFSIFSPHERLKLITQIVVGLIFTVCFLFYNLEKIGYKAELEYGFGLVSIIYSGMGFVSILYSRIAFDLFY
jgi:hypothetical protein